MLHVKTAFICTVVGIGFGLAIGRFGPTFSANANADAPRADLIQPVAFVTNPIVPAASISGSVGSMNKTD